MTNKKTPLKEENKILDNALDNYAEVLKNLVEAITNNIEPDNGGVPQIALQYIADELEEAKKLNN